MDRRRLSQLPMFPTSNDLTSTIPVNINPTRNDIRQTPGNQKRKQTLLTILDALNELSNQGLDQDSGDGTTLMDDESEEPSADDQLQAKGAAVFNSFQRRVQQLDKELQNFANAVRQLGSSVGILSSSYHLRQRLTQILFLFRESAADLFPRKVQRESRELNLPIEVRKRIRGNQTRRRKDKATNVARPTVQENLTLECLPGELECLARDVTTFLACLNEFPEFTDEAVNASILAFEGDLKYWASCMKEFEGQFRYPAVERYVHDLSVEMGDHLDNITTTIGVFVEVGVPTIRFAQKHAASNLLNLSTVATFFSAVTATTIQFSYSNVQGTLPNAVNAFWFGSLVFSIASAVNSLLGLTWKQAMYRSPRHRVPWWVLIWIRRSPLIFLVVSVAAFSIGLVLFTWSSNQHLSTCILTTMFTGFSSFGLVAVSAWFAFERITYSRHKGKRWLADVLAELNADIQKYTGMAWCQKVLPRCTERVRKWSGTAASYVAALALSGVRALDVRQARKNGQDTDCEEGTLPFSSPTQESIMSPIRPSVSHSFSVSDVTTMRVDSPTPITPLAPLLDPSTSPTLGNNTGDAADSPSATQQEQRPSPKTRFASAVHSVIMLQKATSQSPLTTMRKISGQNPPKGRTRMAHRRDSSEPFTAAKLQRLIMLSHALKHVETSEVLQAHQALVRHLQFSPNGKWLATCSWDRTSVLFKVGNGEPFVSHRTLAHPQGFVNQVAWAPKGGHLITKLHHSVKIWTEDGVCIRTIERHRTIQSIAWLPSGKEFISVEGTEVNRVDLSGNLLDSYPLPRLALHDVAATQDEERLLCVATLTESPDGLQPHKARKEKRIVVYNMQKKEIESQVPVLYNVRDITVASCGHLALVSYEDKAPPQLWRLDKVNDDVRLSLRHTYMPHTDVDFAGPSYFGGRSDQLILCAGKNGHIHIWDRESAHLLHDLRVPEGDLTGIAWNTSSDTPMFATGSHDGAVKIWTSPLQQPLPSEWRSPWQSQSQAESPSPMGRILTESPIGQNFEGQLPPLPKLQIGGKKLKSDGRRDGRSERSATVSFFR